MRLNSMNTGRFTGRADIYERYRMRFPSEAILQAMQEICSLTPDSMLADIGAGTGMLTETFLQNGNTVYAVEPNDEMRAAAQPLQRRYPRLTLVDATAEATTLPDNNFDIVTAGRAFHWFDRERAITEFERILKPHGWLVLISASRDKTSTPANRAAELLLSKQSEDRERTGGGHHIHENAQAIFPDSRIVQRKLQSEAALTRDHWIGQTLSFSSAPLASSSEHESFVHNLNEIFDQHAEKDGIRVPEICWITCVLLRP